MSRIEIRNFRSIRHLVVELGETTVFVGPNNAGKTAILDALRIALTRRWGQRGTGFTEYDIHLARDNDSPKESSGVSIEIHAQESEPEVWADSIVADLADIVQLDPDTRLNSITLRTQCAWNEESGAFEPVREFLNAAGDPLTGRGARRVNLQRFWRYLPVFYLGALRDVGDEFSPRSQFWGRLLKAVKIPPELEEDASQELDQLNRRLLKADTRLEKIAETLSGATQIAARDRKGEVDLRMVPLKMWDLLSRAGIILRNDPDSPWLPLLRQGQGIQSLSVIFLFQAFVEHLVRELYEPDTEPLLALEEPETHLHPQAARTLWTHVQALPGQKIVTTHSPYFLQHVPFRDLRLVRLTQEGTQVKSLPANFSASIPALKDLEDHVLKDLEDIVSQSSDRLSYQRASGTFTVNGPLDEGTYHRLLTCCGRHEQRIEIESTLRGLRDRSSFLIGDDEIQSLETFARRMRGEIFFAERWLIVEGQSDYLVVHALAHAMGYDLDAHGVSVIDAQNNGKPATFAALARAFDIPWLAVFDGDRAGRGYTKAIANRGFPRQEIGRRCRKHDAGDLEAQLVADGLDPVLREILTELGIQDARSLADEALHEHLRNNKTSYAAALAARFLSDSCLAQRAPAAFRDTIDELQGLE